MPTVLVTGANRGIGLEFARQYAAEGWDVIATARTPEKADALNAIDGARILPLEVTEEESVAALVDDLGGEPVDIFINNAGVYGPSELNREEWLDTFDVNCVSPTRLACALKPNVAASEEKKMAILTSKMGSITDNGSGGRIVYRSSKAAANAAWKSLALDWRDDGIAVGILHPGWVETDMGGPNALIDTETSVSGMRTVLADLDTGNAGRFIAYDGKEIGW